MTLGVLSAPRLATERMILRAPRHADFEPLREVFMSDRARHMGGPMRLGVAWRDFAAGAGDWALGGYGNFVMEARDPAAFGGARILGQIFLHHPPHFPEREIGWMTVPAAEGTGAAFEAATAVRLWAARTLGGPALVSYIAAANARSIALAERLGARRDPGAPIPDFGDGNADDDGVWRHPDPQALIEEAAA
ncbi:MAG: GNAT family N-acetyltransferase [Pseudomonadota bacterium]